MGCHCGNMLFIYLPSPTKTGFKVEISDLGATLLSVYVPDKDGNFENVTYGHDKPETYLNTPGYFGATVGRIANRIDHAQFELDGKVYNVTPNHKVVHQLHGGKKGFSYKVWSIIEEETGIFDELHRLLWNMLVKMVKKGIREFKNQNNVSSESYGD